MEWISVKEKMPIGDVLLLTTSKYIVMGDWYKEIWRVTGSVQWNNGKLESDYQKEDITHWMPLPERPKD